MARVVRLAHDANHLVEIEVCDQQAFQHMQTLVDLVEPVADAPGNDLLAVVEPLLENPHPSFSPGGADPAR